MRSKNIRPSNVFCAHCGTPFFKQPSQFRRSPAHYCSRECFNNRASKPSNVVCETCGTPFRKAASTIARRPRHFCSWDCANKRDVIPPFDNGDGTATIPLSKGMVSIVDSADIELVSAYTWHASMTRGDRHYAKTNLPNGGTMYLHRLILEMPDGVVDHISGNSLDNRKCNLRVVSVAENNLNRSAQSNSQSGYKGVSPKGSKWTATIKRGDVIVRLGTFDTPEEAARAYDDAAIDLHGEFAHLNYRR